MESRCFTDIIYFHPMLTGIILVTNYIPHINLAASSIEHLMRDVYMGWFLRYVHISGVSFYFLSLYIHIAAALIMGRLLIKKRPMVKWSYNILFKYVDGIHRYILPWGQMSFWAATVLRTY